MHHASIALALANEMIAARFGTCHGTRTWAEYQAFALQRATGHLAEHLAGKIGRTTGSQRRRARITLEDGTLIIALPMNDPRTGATLWAETELTSYLDLIEGGADGAWFYNYQGRHRARGQVRTTVPCHKHRKVTVARLIVDAKDGQQARRRDADPLNLRRANRYRIGQPGTTEGRAGNAKRDAQAEMREGAAIREAATGRGYGYNIHEE